LRSPPPPAPQSQPPPQQQHQQSYGYPQQTAQGGASAYTHPAFGGFINDSTAQMGFQVGKSAMMAGQEYMEQNVRFDDTHLQTLLTRMLVQPLRERLGSQTLLQRL
jgi:hypothetical protein